MVDLQGAVRNAGIMAWRDDQSLALVHLLQEGATTGLTALEDQLGSVSLIDAFSGSEARARALVRPAMRDFLRPRLHELLTRGAARLRQIDERLEQLALSYAHVGDRPLMPGEEPVVSRASLARRAMPEIFASRISELSEKLDSAIPDTISGGLRNWSDRASHQLGEGMGARARLRTAGANEIRTAWTGPSTLTEQPFLSRLTDRVDAIAATARNLLE